MKFHSNIILFSPFVGLVTATTTASTSASITTSEILKTKATTEVQWFQTSYTNDDRLTEKTPIQFTYDDININTKTTTSTSDNIL